MFKVISAEIKKIVSKPGIYILAILLAVILILGTFIYDPKVNETEVVTLQGSTYTQKYNDFTGGGNANAGLKAEVKTKVDNAVKSVNNYNIIFNGETYSQEKYINLLVSKFEDCYNAYQDSANDDSDETYISNTARPNVISSLKNLNTAIEQAILNSKDGSYSIITSTDNYETYKTAYKNSLAWAEIKVSKQNLNAHILDFKIKYKDVLLNSISNFKYPALSAVFVKDFTSIETGSKLAILNERLNNINIEIETYYQKAVVNANNDDINTAGKMDELANLYLNTANTFVNLVKYELLTKAFSTLSTNEQLKALNLSSYSKYDCNSLLIRYDYLFENNKNATDYNRPLTIGMASGDDISAYDYSYFVLRLFSFVIIVYAIMAACHSIAGEIKEGSMRYFAIRPVSRTKLFLGKWLSILLMSIILIIFSAIISLSVGGAVYGFNSHTILTIFNGTTALTLHPLGMIGVYLLSMLLELMIYSALAMLLSTLFKSDLLSVTILLVFYLINTLLPMFIQGANTWLSFYPFSHISLYSLFGSSIYAVSGDFFNLMLGAKVYAGTHIALTISIITILIIGLSALAIKVFKNKEL